MGKTTTLAPFGPTVPSNIPPTTLPSYLQPSVSLSIGSPVLPGQPISVSWSYADPLLDLSAGTATANFFVPDLNQPGAGNIQVNAQPWTVPISTAVGLFGVDTSAQSGFLESAVQEIENLLYAVGSRLIELQINVTGTDFTGSPYSQTYTVFAILVVLAEDPTTWREWITPSPLDVQWNSSYQLIGQISNRSQFATMTVNQLLLIQTDDAGKTNTTPVSAPPPISPQQSESIPVGQPLTQAWQWMDPTFYIVDGPTSRTFQYEFEWQMTDNFGNLYPDVLLTPNQPQQTGEFIESFPLFVNVSVSQAKLTWEIAAVAWLVVAGALSVAQAVAGAASAVAGASGGSSPTSGSGLISVIAAIGGGFFSVCSWFCNAIAQGDANNAKDPPVPDYNCRDVVSVGAPVFEIPGGQPRLRPLKMFFDAAAVGSWSQAAISATEGKILGAKLAVDSQGERIQRQSLNRIRQSLRAAEIELKRSHPLARRVLALILRAYEASLQTGVSSIKRNGLAKGIRSDLLERRIPAPVIDMGLALVKSGRLDDDLVSFLLASFDKAGKTAGVAIGEALQATDQRRLTKNRTSRRGVRKRV